MACSRRVLRWVDATDVCFKLTVWSSTNKLVNHRRHRVSLYLSLLRPAEVWKLLKHHRESAARVDCWSSGLSWTIKLSCDAALMLWIVGGHQANSTYVGGIFFKGTSRGTLWILWPGRDFRLIKIVNHVSHFHLKLTSADRANQCRSDVDLIWKWFVDTNMKDAADGFVFVTIMCWKDAAFIL